MNKDSLGDRMKGYERCSKFNLMRRTPVIIRVDGKAFHTFTRAINEKNDPSSKTGPSEMMHTVMVKTMFDMMGLMQNAVFGYTQSDEISILLRDWDKHETEQWFDASVQKIASVSASYATCFFGDNWNTEFGYYPVAFFDARVFNVPMEEVTNYFIWRQQDASRNSVQFIARKYFSHKQLLGFNNSQIQDKLMLEKGVNWNDYDTWKKRGSCTYRTEGGLYNDYDIPLFTKDREFVEGHLTPNE